MYQVLLAKKAEKDLKKVDKNIKEKALSLLLRLQKDPYLGKKLAGKYKNCYSLRLWPFRIIYEIYKEKEIVLVIRIGHRKDVYR